MERSEIRRARSNALAKIDLPARYQDLKTEDEINTKVIQLYARGDVGLGAVLSTARHWVPRGFEERAIEAYDSHSSIVMEHKEVPGWLLKGAFETHWFLGRINKGASLAHTPRFLLPEEIGQISLFGVPNRSINALRAVVAQRGAAALRDNPELYRDVVLPQVRLCSVGNWRVRTPPVYLPVAQKMEVKSELSSIAAMVNWDEATLRGRLGQLFQLNQTLLLADLHTANAVVTQDGKKIAIIDLEPVGGMYDKNDDVMATTHRDVDPRIFGIAGIRKFQTSAILLSGTIAGKRGDAIETLAERAWADMPCGQRCWTGCWQKEVWIKTELMIQRILGVDTKTKEDFESALAQIEGTREEKREKIRRFQKIVLEVGDRIAAEKTREYGEEYGLEATEIEATIAEWAKKPGQSRIPYIIAGLAMLGLLAGLAYLTYQSALRMPDLSHAA